MNLYSDEIIKEEKQESLNIVDTYAYFTETILDAHHILFFNKYQFNLNFKAMYNCKGGNKEILVKELKFFSLNNIIKTDTNFDYILDIGIINLGNDHLKTLSMSKDNGKLFFRLDNIDKNYKPYDNELFTFNKLIK